MHQLLQTLPDLGEHIWMIVITGGPCGGKTSALALLRSKLTDRGYRVLIVPESATKLIGAGIHPGPGGLDGAEFQREVIADTLAQEARTISAAKRFRDRGEKVVILCDRGTMDGAAYVEPQVFASMLDELGYNPRVLCDERYHAVMHLQTAAIGAERFYTLETNSARTESPELARALDQRTLDAWSRHPHPRLIDNSTGFDEKLERLFAEICTVLGDPVPIEKEDKFLVDASEPIIIPVRFHESRIVQDYLTAPDMREEYRVRSRTDREGTTFYFTRKRYVAPGDRIEIERMVTGREYASLLTLRDYRLQTIEKRRLCFFWKGQFFELDLFERPEHEKGLVLLEAERTDRTPTLELPPFIRVVRNVTGEKRYSNQEIAKRR
jgi:CYTH domain-containing protein/predicted ATPase